MQTGNAIMPLTVPRQADPVHACPPREDPTSGWRRCGWSAGVWPRLMGLSSWRSQSAWRHGVHQERPGHPPAPPLHAVRVFDTPRRDDQPRVCEPPPAPFHVRRAGVGGADRGSPPLAGVDRGAQDLAGLGGRVRLQRVGIGKDVRRDWPRRGLEGRGRRGTALARVAVVVGARRGREAVRRPALGPGAEGLWRGGGSAHAWGVPRHAGRRPAPQRPVKTPPATGGPCPRGPTPAADRGGWHAPTARDPPGGRGP